MDSLMDVDEALRLIRSLHVWERDGERAPHKPLLLLLAFGRAANGMQRLIPWSEIETPLRKLLEEFGPARHSQHPEYPFWYLRNDGLWEIEKPELAGRRLRGNGRLGNPRISELRRCNTRGGLPVQLYELVTGSQDVLRELAAEVLNRHFPASFHEEIIEEIGLALEADRFWPYRNTKLEGDILEAYGFECAVCGFGAGFGARSFGVEGTFIRWPQAGGLPVVNNAVALCAIHKRAFERGALGVDSRGRILLSAALKTRGTSETLFRPYLGQLLRPPRFVAAAPDRECVKWHREQVFRGPAVEA